MKFSFLVPLFLALSLSGYANGFDPNHHLRREILRIAVEAGPLASPTKISWKEDSEGSDLQKSLNSAKYSLLGFGAFGQAIQTGSILKDIPLNTIIFDRKASGLALLVAGNAILTVYLWCLAGGGHDWASERPVVAGSSSLAAGGTLLIPQILAILFKRDVYKHRSDWLVHGSVWAGAGSFFYRASQNFSAGPSGKTESVQLSPEDFRSFERESLRKQILDDRAYILGIEEPRKVAILKEVMATPGGLERLPDLTDDLGEPLIPPRRIENFLTLGEIAEELLEDPTEAKELIGAIIDGNRKTLKQEFEFNVTLLSAQIEVLRERSEENASIRRSETALKRSLLLKDQI